MKKTRLREFTPTRDEKIVEFCDSKRVLHIGACDSPYTESKLRDKLLLHLKLDEVSSELVGIDNDQESIDLFRSLTGVEITYFDMNNISELAYTPDVIVFGETIEHVENLKVCLELLRTLMNDNTLLLISTPNAYFILNFWRAIKGEEIVHPDHNLILSPETLDSLLNKNDLETESIFMTFLNRKSLSFKDKIIRAFAKMFPLCSETMLVTARRK